MLHCDLRVRWKVASDLRFRAAISEPKTPSFCGICGDLAPSTRKSLAIAIFRFWCAKQNGSDGSSFRFGSVPVPSCADKFVFWHILGPVCHLRSVPVSAAWQDRVSEWRPLKMSARLWTFSCKLYAAPTVLPNFMLETQILQKTTHFCRFTPFLEMQAFGGTDFHWKPMIVTANHRKPAHWGPSP